MGVSKNQGPEYRSPYNRDPISYIGACFGTPDFWKLPNPTSVPAGCSCICFLVRTRGEGRGGGTLAARELPKSLKVRQYCKVANPNSYHVVCSTYYIHIYIYVLYVYTLSIYIYIYDMMYSRGQRSSHHEHESGNLLREK